MGTYVHFGLPLAFAACAFFLVVWSLSAVVRTTMSAGSVTVRGFRGSRQFHWSQIAGMTTQDSFNMGTRIVLILHSGERLMLPAPTSFTGGLVEAQTLARAFQMAAV